jgi:hypothetical protein
VPEPEEGQQAHCGGSDEAGPRGIHGDLSHGAEGVGVEQQAAQRLTLEGQVDQAGRLLVVRVRPSSVAQLGVGLAASGLFEVHLDEVVGVGLGLGTGDQLLPGVLLEVRLHLRVLQLVAAGLREVDVLGRELGVDVVAHEAVGPGEKPARDEEYCGDNEAARREQGIKGASSHGCEASSGLIPVVVSAVLAQLLSCPLHTSRQGRRSSLRGGSR